MVAGAREQALVELSPSDLGRLGLLADGTAALSPSDAPINPAYSDDAHTQGQRKGGWRRFIDKQRGRQRLGPHPAASAAAPSAAALETSVVEGLRSLGALAADPESLVSDDLPDDLPEMPPLPVAPPAVPLLRDPPPQPGGVHAVCGHLERGGGPLHPAGGVPPFRGRERGSVSGERGRGGRVGRLRGRTPR